MGWCVVVFLALALVVDLVLTAILTGIILATMQIKKRIYRASDYEARKET